MQNQIEDVLIHYIDSIDDIPIITAIGSAMVNNGVFQIGDFGTDQISKTGKEKLKQKIKGINITNDDLPIIFEGITTDLEKFYQEKKRNSNTLFIICLIAISLVFLIGVGTFIAIIIKIHGTSSKIATGTLGTGFSIFSAFLGHTYFKMYKEANKELTNIENEIKRAGRLKEQLKLINILPEQERNKKMLTLIDEIIKK